MTQRKLRWLTYLYLCQRLFLVCSISIFTSFLTNIRLFFWCSYTSIIKQTDSYRETVPQHSSCQSCGGGAPGWSCRENSKCSLTQVLFDLPALFFCCPEVGTMLHMAVTTRQGVKTKKWQKNQPFRFWTPGQTCRILFAIVRFKPSVPLVS